MIMALTREAGMTFRIGSDFSRALLVAAALGVAAGCSRRTPGPSSGAAPATEAASATATESAAARVAPQPTDSRIVAAPAARSTAPAAADSEYVKWDPGTKTVTFRLVAGPFEFNHFTNGGGTLTVPAGSTNVWNFLQDDGTPHSAEVASGTGPVPNSGGDPAIPRAYTNKVVEGMAQGATDVINFTAPDTGSYRIICGVPGHALSGMWIWLKIDPNAKSPSFGATPK
jgi:sulfocyanin SoxE-like protein